MKTLLLFLSITACAQVLNPDSTVTMPLETYRDMRDKWYYCDTLHAIDREIISVKDTVIVLQSRQIESYKREIVNKDATITGLANVKPHRDWKFWFGVATGLVGGILLMK